MAGVRLSPQEAPPSGPAATHRVAPGTPALTDIQVAEREGGSNRQQTGPGLAGSVQDAAQLKGVVVIAMVTAGPLSSC